MRISGVITAFLLVTAICGCSREKKQVLKTGVWRGVITLQGQELPFNFAVSKDTTGKLSAYLKNGEENLLLDEIRQEGDSVILTMHIFDSELKVHADGDSLKGYFIKNYEPGYRLPFVAAHDQDFRFTANASSQTASRFRGKYAVTFINNTDTTQAVGLLDVPADNMVIGSFLTPTGDYRYLEGNVVHDKLYLSAFDGNHAYLFTAKFINDSTLAGEYWSGRSSHQTWTGIKNDRATIGDAETLTYLKEGHDKVNFRFPDENGNMASLDDAKYQGKVVIVQLLGSWCPNCLDETRFLVPWYRHNKERGVEIIGLAYESKDDFDYASERIKKMKSKLGIPYTIALAGSKDKDKASSTLPMLNKVSAFPTTIFIGKDGKVKKIHTGFSGPGTGIYYKQFIQYFDETVNELIMDNGQW